MKEIDGEKSEKTNKEEEDNIFLVIKPPMVKAERPPASNLESEGSSIEVELRDPRSSFSSYDSVDENVTERPFLLDDMEMTGCVGGIIQANGDHRDENQTMDLTSCLGGILQNLPRASTSPSVLESIHPVSPSSVDTMELTRVVGGIIGGLVRTDESPMAVEHHSARHEGEKSKGTRHGEKHHEKNKDDKEMGKMKSDLDHVEVDMDETQVMKPPTTTLQMKKTTNATPPRSSTSPSPFLVETPLNSEMSFIGDMAAPRSLGCGASPAPSRRSQDVLEEMDLTTELFNKYIDTSRFNSLTLHGANDDDVVKREADEFNRITQTMEMAVGTPRVTAALPSSQTESPTVTLILPRASLRDFLNDTGIRFLDNLSSLTRRETTGRPRESELVSAGRQLFVDCGLSLESDAMDEACVELASHIHAVRDELQRQEEHFNHSPPLAFLQYRDPQERLAVISKLKTLKSIARLCAKHAWYEWRQPVHARLNAALAANAALLSPRLAHLSALTGRLDEMRTAVEPKLSILEAELHALQVRSERLPSGPDDGELAVHLEASLATQTARQASIDEEMAKLVRREQELRTSIDRALGRRHELQQSVAHLRSHVNATPEVSPLILADLRSTLELLQGVSGWKLMRVSPDAISLRYPRADLGVTLVLTSNLNHLVVREVSFDVASVQSRLIKHAPRLIRTDPELSPAQVGSSCMGYPQVIYSSVCLPLVEASIAWPCWIVSWPL